MTEPSPRILTTRAGRMVGLETDIYISRSLELYGEYCPGEHRLLTQLIRPGMVVVEVGANIGSHTVSLAKACAPGTLYAFEPQPRVFQILCANLALNDIGNALAYPEACGESAGWARIPRLNYRARGNFGGVALEGEDAAGWPVRVTPLDALELPRLDLLKIDVEGFEPQVLRGARETIARFRPVIYTENDRKDQQGEIIALIAGMGYDLYWHTPPLFEPDNFNGATENVFGQVKSLNMLCVPTERNITVVGLTRLDPDNWTSPIRLQR